MSHLMDDEPDENIVYKVQSWAPLLGDLPGEGCPRGGKVRRAGVKGVSRRGKSQKKVGCEWGSRNTVHSVRPQRPSGRKEGSSCAIQEDNSGSKATGRKARIHLL